MRQTKLAAVIASMLPIGAAAEMLPTMEPVNFKQVCREIIPEAYGIPGMNPTRDRNRHDVVSGVGKRKMVHRNRNILSSTKPIR